MSAVTAGQQVFSGLIFSNLKRHSGKECKIKTAENAVSFYL